MGGSQDSGFTSGKLISSNGPIHFRLDITRIIYSPIYSRYEGRKEHGFYLKGPYGLVGISFASQILLDEAEDDVTRREEAL